MPKEVFLLPCNVAMCNSIHFLPNLGLHHCLQLGQVAAACVDSVGLAPFDEPGNMSETRIHHIIIILSS
jgi:hypothetical protein